MTWSQIATAVGTEITVGTQFSEIVGAWFPHSVGRPDPCATIEGIFDTEPAMGSLPPELIDVVYDHTTSRSPAQRPARTRTPNFWWPADRTWCGATGIDEVDTLVVSADLTRLESVHANPGLETQLYSR